MGRHSERFENSSLPDGVIQALDTVARVLFWGGLLALLGGTAIGVLNYARGAGASEAEITRNVNLFSSLGLYGAIAAALGASYLYWGEEILGPMQIIGACVFLFSPAYLPLIITTPPSNPDAILDGISKMGYPLLIVGLSCLVWDVATRIKVRVVQGTRADQLKYGRGLREEKDIRNVFLGKCWQLPYCRKFVRERCPIYHSKRTCWKEKVGCMCEEQVIRNAMEGKVIPRDMVAAAKFIPYNSKLSPDQKKERCRMCVIFNEHQKHKYKALLPLALATVGLLYFLFRVPAASLVLGLISAANRLLTTATLDAVQKDALKNVPSVGGIMLHEILTAVLFFILAVYSIRVVETVVFKMKL